ncbi:peptidoglycan DD-metalloendopeptidase family protein [Streptomyces sp. NBC_01013]|uniref:peptidoglycan DD-metalloendopeptidase family protein n=1 Tax=Streptomyces sp. NBC_01013 TaxID=2903718 RepID=UPI00386FCCEC|nr:M23 family metallopeptidase [Streptomyces sp. NBC_01013]
MRFTSEGGCHRIRPGRRPAARRGVPAGASAWASGRAAVAASGLLLVALLMPAYGGLYALAAEGPPPRSAGAGSGAGAAGEAGEAGIDPPGEADGRVPAPAGPIGEGVWPLEGRPTVLRGWEPPATEYGRGHRGVDLGAAPGARVLAAAAGRVSFAGGVAGRGVVVIELAGTGDPPLRTTYEPVRPLVGKGDQVTAGQVVAVMSAGPSHCAPGCLHWGLRRGDAYLDPLSLLPPSLLRHGPSRLLPVSGVPLPDPPQMLSEPQ